MRILEPSPGVVAFYDGRVDGVRFADTSNWVDDGALSLGIASYAVIDGEDALVYDTHVTTDHAAQIRRELERRGARRFRVLLSHWHLDHIAGTEVFADSEVIAGARTAEYLVGHRRQIESGSHDGPPAIDPLILPTTIIAGQETLQIGSLSVELIPVDIHSDDAVIVWFPDRRLLLAGDTLEDTITYVAEPGSLETHLVDLSRLAALNPARILPNHGDPATIAAGGYDRGLITATEHYVRALLRIQDDPSLAATPLADLLDLPLRAGWIRWFQPYERVHEENLAAILNRPPD